MARSSGSLMVRPGWVPLCKWIPVSQGRREGARPRALPNAWVEAYLPGMGWLGFDPTNKVAAGESHVRTAVGRDYAGIPHTKGVLRFVLRRRTSRHLRRRRWKRTIGRRCCRRSEPKSIGRQRNNNSSKPAVIQGVYWGCDPVSLT